MCPLYLSLSERTLEDRGHERLLLQVVAPETGPEAPGIVIKISGIQNANTREILQRNFSPGSYFNDS